MKPRFRWLLPVVVACAHGTPADTPSARVPLAVDPLALLEAVPDTFTDGTRIHLSTDRAVFRPGDTVRLQSWLVSGAALAPEPDDGLGPPGMRYDLVNPQGSAVSSILVAEEAGFGRASLDLAPDAPGGLWTIRGRVAAIEVGAGEVVLYWDGIDASATLEVALDLTAEFPGTTTGAPSSAWPHYASGSRSWSAPLAIEVLEVRGGP